MGLHSLDTLNSFWEKESQEYIKWNKIPKKALIKRKEKLREENNTYSPFEWFKGGSIDIKRTLFKSKYSNDISMTKYIGNKNSINIKYCTLFKNIYQLTKSKISSDKINRVMIIGSASPETSTIMLTSALLGKCHCVLFEDLSVESIVKRIEIFKPNIIYIKNTFDNDKLALLSDKLTDLNIIKEIYYDFYDESDNSSSISENELIIDNYFYSKINSTDIESEKEIFCLFTSGSTGKPKAIWHSYGGYLTYAAYSFIKFFKDSGAIESIFCGTDAAWINGHTYALYGPILSNTRTIFIKDLSSLQNPIILEDFIKQTNPNFFYSSVTLLRAIRSLSLITRKYNALDSSNINCIGSCGEPLADEVGNWALKYFDTNNKFIVNTYFQTETGGVILAPTVNDNNSEDNSSVGKELFPIKIIFNSKDSTLLIGNPWPGCFKRVTSDKETNYWDENNNFKLHDIGYKDEKEFIYIGGRSDDEINISGHRISTAEVESTTLSTSNSIWEAAAVEVEDIIIGSKLVLFIVVNKNYNLPSEKLKSEITNKLTPFHRPWKIIKIDCLPKTKSGKIARRLLRDYLTNGIQECGQDLSTIINYEDFNNALKSIE